MKSPPWFRLYSEVLSDRKIQRICQFSGQPKALIIGVWTTLLAMASDSPERGKLLISDDLSITIEDISLETGLNCEDCSLLIEAFITVNMIYKEADVFVVTQWNSRQFSSDTSNERVQKFRERKQQTGKKVKRECNVTVTPPESDTDTDTDTDINTSPNGEGEKTSKLKRPLPIPAVKIFVEVTGKHILNRTQTEALRLKVGTDPPELEKWRETVKAWMLRGYKITNIDGMLDWFINGIPQRNGDHGNDKSKGTRGEGKSSPPGIEPGTWANIVSELGTG